MTGRVDSGKLTRKKAGTCRINSTGQTVIQVLFYWMSHLQCLTEYKHVQHTYKLTVHWKKDVSWQQNFLMFNYGNSSLLVMRDAHYTADKCLIQTPHFKLVFSALDVVINLCTKCWLKWISVFHFTVLINLNMKWRNNKKNLQHSYFISFHWCIFLVHENSIFIKHVNI